MRHGRLDAAGGEDFSGDDDDSGQGRGVKEWRRQQGGPRRAWMPQEYCRCRGGRFPLFRSVSAQGARCNPCLQTGGRVCESGLAPARNRQNTLPDHTQMQVMLGDLQRKGFDIVRRPAGAPCPEPDMAEIFPRFDDANPCRAPRAISLSLSLSLCPSLHDNKETNERTNSNDCTCICMCRLHSPEGLVMILILAMRPHFRCRRRNRKHMRIHRGRKDRVDRGDSQGRATQGERRQGRRRDGVHGPALR
jgi:hypothetical protein